MKRSAVVMSGGGTRGAYEAGVIHYIRTMLPPSVADKLRFQIQCGSSVGAINAAFMVATAHEPRRQGEELVRLWRNISSDKIYRRGPLTLGKLLARSVFGIISHLLGLKGFSDPEDSSLQFQGLFDTQPFFHTLRQHCPWNQLTKNIEKGLVHALAISATNMQTGEIELFLQKRPEIAYTERFLTRVGKINPRHVLASAALPILFPPVPIHGIYYNDGGLRLTTPLAPAVALGANQILIIGTRYIPTVEEIDTQIRIVPPRPPGLGEVLAKFFHATLLDRLEADKAQVDRINRILATCEKHVSEKVYEKICTEARVTQIKEISIFPSMDIATLVDETVRGSFRKLKSIGILERSILRLLETDPEQGTDLLSYFLFEPSYLRKLIDLGFEDARSQHDALMTFAESALSE